MDNKTFTKKYYIDRTKADTVKWSNYKKDGCLPMWVADMDFRCDERVIKELKKFIETGDYGYNNLPEDYYEVFIGWHKKRNNVTYRQEWIRFSKGAVNAMYQVVNSLTKPHDAIMINTPLYPPFRNTIVNTKRKVVESRLLYKDGLFTFDYEDIEKKFKEKKVKMLMMCSPHNPLGRVWTKNELERLFALCRKYRVLILSDEVHSDFVMPGNRFIPAMAMKKYQDLIISIVAASKSFSLAVYSHSHIIIANEKLREKLIKYQQLNSYGSVNVMNALPTYYCYKYGEEWMDGVNSVIYENYCYFKDKLGPYLEMTQLQGSYLLFVNLGKYNTKQSAAECIKENCHIRVNPGESFSKKYDSWVRINLATSLDNVRKAVDSILKFIDS